MRKETAMNTPATPTLPRWMKALIIASLALNLLVLGAGAGMAIRFAGGDGPPAFVSQAPGFGPWTKALKREDYRALRKAFDDKGHDFRAFTRQDREDRSALIAALRATPFDLAAFDAAHGRMAKRNLDRLELGQDLIRTHIMALTPERRAEIADRMARRMKPRDP